MLLVVDILNDEAFSIVNDVIDGGYVGINYSGMHDTAFTFISKDGAEVLSFSLERLTREKHDGRWPIALMNGIDFSKAASIGLSTNLGIEKPFEAHDREFYHRISRLTNAKITFHDHHLSHAASALAFYELELGDYIFVLDGGMYNSPDQAALYRVGESSKLIKDYSLPVYESRVAILYTWVTAILGMKPSRHEGKVTGLAASGRATPRLIKALKDVLELKGDSLNRAISWHNCYSIETPPNCSLSYPPELTPYEEILKAASAADCAASLQTVLEDKVFFILDQALGGNRRLNSKLALSGGVFANVLLNLHIAENWSSEGLYVSPPMGDDGCSLGAAYLESIKHNVKPHRLSNTFIGLPAHSQKCLQSDDLSTLFLDEDIQTAVNLLCSGSIIAITLGRAEFGPRALGNRSILAIPSSKEVSSTINQMLNRTETMPFAPMVRDIDERKYFVSTKSRQDLRYMTTAVHVTDLFKQSAPAVVHVDGTCRPQLIERKNTPFIYDILCQLEARGLPPVLINTSFNVHGKAIVQSSEDAIEDFNESGLDALFLNGKWVFK